MDALLHLDDSEPPVDNLGSLQRLMGAPAAPPRTPPSRVCAIPGAPTLDAESPAVSFDDASQVAMGGGGVHSLLTIYPEPLTKCTKPRMNDSTARGRSQEKAFDQIDVKWADQAAAKGAASTTASKYSAEHTRQQTLDANLTRNAQPKAASTAGLMSFDDPERLFNEVL